MHALLLGELRLGVDYLLVELGELYLTVDDRYDDERESYTEDNS